MNLKEVLDYRRNCPLCNEKLKLDTSELANIIVVESEDNLSFMSDIDTSISFKFGGYYSKTVKWQSVFSEVLKVKKTCSNCTGAKYRNGTILGKSRIEIDDTKDHYSYAFSIYTHGDFRKYHCQLDREHIKTMHQNKYWHLGQLYEENVSKIIITDTNESPDYDDYAPDIIELPIIKLSKNLNKEYLIGKISKLSILS